MPAPNDAAERFALVTGTSAGIGAALADQLLARGWQVVGIARRAAAIDHPHYEQLRLDLGDLAALAAAVESRVVPRLADPRLQRVGLVNNAATTGQLGPVDHLDAESLGNVYAVNTAAPVWLMGRFVRACASATRLRIVNVSSGAAVRAFPGLSAYGSSKAALRFVATTLAAELDAPERSGSDRDVAILSYEPGVVDTAMQATARSIPKEAFPWVGMFQQFAERGVLVQPAAVTGEIVRFLESDTAARFAERRFGG